MSAYIVENETINRIVAFLPRYILHHAPWLADDLHVNVTDDESLGQLAKAMFSLNVDAVNARYGDNEAKKFRPLDYQFAHVIPNGNLSTLKSLQCLLYQCSEGDVPERELYKGLRAVETAIMHDVISSLPEYEAAPWA